MKRCLNCRQTYDDHEAKCPHCGYAPRSKSIATRRFEPKAKPLPQQQSSAQQKKAKSFNTGKKNIYAASSHSGAFYIKSGERLNKRYSVINVMGFGAFGVAYECFDNFTKQHVVVKEYMPSYLCTRCANGRDVEPISEDAEAQFQIGCDSFIDENEKMRDNNVECVPPLIECFRQNNTAYAVTELIGGESLSSVLSRKGKLSYETTSSIITSVLQGLRRLNKIGVIHGDICPENIIVLSENQTFLLDYNLSDFNKNIYTQRENGKPRPGYSALELYYKNLEVGPWTDVYAAAAVMYKMLTGMVVPAAVKRSAGDTLTPVSKLGVPISAGAERAMLKALKVDYTKRAQSPEDFLNGFVGDGFDNITAVKGRKKPAAPAVPSRSSYNSKSSDGSGFLKGILVFLTLAIIAVVIWFFVSGVFPMPKAVGNFLGMPSETASDTASKKHSDTDKGTDSDSKFFTESRREKDTDTDKDASSKGIFDGLVSKVASGITSGITSGVNSLIDEYIPSRDEENTSSASDDSYYYDDQGYYDEYGNYHYYNDDGGDYNDGGNNDNGGYDENGDNNENGENNGGDINDFIDNAADTISGFFEE